MRFFNLFFLIICPIILFAIMTSAQANNPQITIVTTKGTIIVELDREVAPATVDNFLVYVRDGFYDGTIFHRVIKGFMIQGGGLTADMKPKATKAPVKNEANNGLKNKIGTIAMARTPDPHSATSQFFINVADNAFLDFKSKTSKGWGYCVFGRVIQGLEIVRTIENTPTTNRSGHQNVPIEPIVIKKVTLVEMPPAK